jgi:hypothetical protein
MNIHHVWVHASILRLQIILLGSDASTCHCTHVHMFLHNLLNVIVQIANKMGLQKKIRQEYLRSYDLVIFKFHSLISI